MTDKQAVYLYRQGQVFPALDCVVEHYRRMMKRREIDPTKVYIVVGSLIGDSHTFLQRRLPDRRYV